VVVTVVVDGVLVVDLVVGLVGIVDAATDPATAAARSWSG